MALIVLLRGINVGGHRAFRPTLLAHELGAYDVVNIGAAGTLVVRKPSSQAHLRAELRSRLPVATQFVLCEGKDLLRLAESEPFEQRTSADGLVQFVSFLARAPRARPSLPLTIPDGQDWLVRVTTLTKRLAIGEYRRQMRTIGCLSQLDTLFGTLVVTRSSGTVNAILRLLKDQSGTRQAQYTSPLRRISTKRPNDD